MDGLVLYPNIWHGEGLSALRKRLKSWKEKYNSTNTILDLAEMVLKNTIFTLGNNTFKQKRCSVVGSNFAPPYSILFMEKLDEELLKESVCKTYLWCRYIVDKFFLWEHGKNKLKSFIDKINKVHPTIKFTAEWSKSSISFLDVTAILKEINRNWFIGC